MVTTCPSDNTVSVDQTSFWSSGSIHWDAHRVGWAISGACTAATVLITCFTVLGHARHYAVPAEQRQIIRILYMPPVYAVISFLSYRFFRSYTYYEIAEVVYEAVTISAFMLLIIEYVAATATDHSAESALARKDKKSLPIPFCCWRYRPTKAYFLYTIKWAVLQYVVIRPLVSIIGIICQKYNILCENEGFNFHFANAYLEIVDFISITVALYGLFMFYGLTKEELAGKRPLAKFLCIKLIVMFTFYQSFVFEWLEGRVIHVTQYWTETNIADGLTALTICIEMVLFAIMFAWAYPSAPYRSDSSKAKLGVGRALVDSINFSDFVREIWGSIIFFIAYWQGRPGTHSKHRRGDFVQTFGVDEASPKAATGFEGLPPNGSNMRAYNAGMNGVPTPTTTNGGGYGEYDRYGVGRPSEEVHLTTFSPQEREQDAATRSSGNGSEDTIDGRAPQQMRAPYDTHKASRRPY